MQQFIVEVDVFDSAVEAVLSQNKEGEMRPCAFFSRCLSPAKQNYNVRNQELLASKLGLEEWSCWLEKSEHTFIMWTDQKNLVYLQTAKRLNTEQVRWALFFTQFNFTITYCHASQNINPLSWQFSTFDKTPDKSTMLPAF